MAETKINAAPDAEKGKSLFLGVVFMSICGVIVLNIGAALLFVFSMPIDYDEFQHMHIVWNMAGAHKLIYRDFFDHHGIVFPLVNYFFFKALDLKASFDIFFLFRLANFAYVALIALLTYTIAFATFKDKALSIFSVAILSSLYFFQTKGLEMRPDTLQNVFWLAGVYLVVAHFTSYKQRTFLLAGISFGLAILTNTKAAFGVAFVFLALVFVLLRSRTERREQLWRICMAILGVIIVQLVPIAYFFAVGGIGRYLQDTYVFSVILKGVATYPWNFPEFIEQMIITQLPFVIGTCIGAAFLLIGPHAKSTERFFLSIALGASLGALLGLYLQFSLTFLPLLSIVCAYGIWASAKHLYGTKKIGWLLSSMLLLAFFLPMEFFLFSKVEMYRMSGAVLIMQKKNTDFILNATKRTDPIGLFWNKCGGYTFNADAQYFWWFDRPVADAESVMAHREVYGKDFVDALEVQKVPFITAEKWMIDSLYLDTTRQYILDNYTFIDPCILKRNSN